MSASMHTDIFAIAMAGGSGTRFWPLSRRARPKQVLPIVGDSSLIEQTRQRCESLGDSVTFYVATRPDLVSVIAETLKSLPAEQIFAEPEPRDTAPCIAYAVAKVLAASNEDAITIFLPADPFIEPLERFQAAIHAGIERARKAPSLVTLGIPPSRPETGYGYIHCGEKVEQLGGLDVQTVDRFTEKPARAVAERYLAEGGYLWNSGIFLWRVGTLLAELDRHAESLGAATRDMAEALREGNEPRVREIFGKLERRSIDYALLEKSEAVEVLSVDFAWDDIGNYASLPPHLERDAQGNATLVQAEGKFLALDSTENIVLREEGLPRELIALIGVKDLVVVRTKDATLVCPKERLGELKELVARLGSEGLEHWL